MVERNHGTGRIVADGQRRAREAVRARIKGEVEAAYKST